MPPGSRQEHSQVGGEVVTLTEKQAMHIVWLNGLPQTDLARRRKGSTPWNRGRNPNISYTCPVCGEPKTAYGKMCKRCSYNNRTHKDRPRIWKTGYRYVEGGDRPRPEHVVIASKILGRPLNTPRECVHHINLHRDDNRHKNLLICEHWYHTWLHQQYAKMWARRFDYVPSSIS